MEYLPTPILLEFTIWDGIIIVIALFVVSSIRSCIKVVKQAETIVIERFGKFDRILQSGLNFIIPVMDRPRPIHQRIYRKDTDGNVNVITKDNENIQITAGLFFQICDVRAVVYEIANLPDAIEELYMTSLRNVVGKMDLNECLASREKISSELSQVMDEATDKWGVKVNRLGIKDIVPTPK